MTTLAPADVEALAHAILPPPAGTRLPNPRPAEFTRVTRAGGSTVNLVLSAPRLLVECWAPTSTAAFDRAREAWAAFHAIEGTTVAGVWVARVELTEPVNFEDPSTTSPRYQFVAQLTTALQETP